MDIYLSAFMLVIALGCCSVVIVIDRHVDIRCIDAGTQGPSPLVLLRDISTAIASTHRVIMIETNS